jgi:hypothetical protein
MMAELSPVSGRDSYEVENTVSTPSKQFTIKLVEIPTDEIKKESLLGSGEHSFECL